MGKLLRFLKNYKKESVLAPLFKMLEASFELLVPVVMKLIIDTGIGNRDKEYVGFMCLVMILLGFTGFVCSVTAQYFSARAAVGYGTELRHALFDHIQSLSYTELDRTGTSKLITRMTSDVNQTQTGINLVLRLFLRSPFIVFGAAVMAFTIDRKAALIFCVTIVLLSVVVFGIMLISIPRYRRVQTALDRLLTGLRENLTGVRVIRAFHREEDEIREFDEKNGTLTRLQKQVGGISAVMNPLTYVVLNGAVVLLVWTGAVRVDQGILTTGDVVALINYMSQILVELVKLANLIITINKSVACGNRIQDVFEMKSSMREGNYDGKDVRNEHPESWEVEFDRVSFTYQGAGGEALSEISFKVKKGQTVGIIGGTGSGKTTLVHLLARFYDATEGKIRIRGTDIREYTAETLRKIVGIVPQKAVLIRGTIRENLCMGDRNIQPEEIQRALEISQAAGIVDGKPDGLDTQVSQNGKNFSGGQRQRLTIARALVRKPEILILDDSSSALDYATDAAFRKALNGMKDKPTLFLVSQRTASLLHADLILVLDDGKAVGAGTHEELLSSCEVYREIYYSQFPGKKTGAEKGGTGE